MNIDWSKCPDATHFDPVDQNFLREVGEALLLFNNKRGWIVPLGTRYGLRIEDCHRPLIKRPEWTGEGLPPVGTVCEFAGYTPEETLPTDPLVGDKVTVIAHFKSGPMDVAAFTFYAPPEFEFLQVGQGAYGCFRPIRTPEQIAAEERDAAVVQMKQCFDSISERLMPTSNQYLETLFGALHDAGYRKQVTP